MGVAEWQADDQRIQEYYANLVRTHGLSYRSLDWGSRQSQEVRFQVLSEIGSLEGCQLLDLGSGLADLFAFLKQQKIELDYTGYDVNPEAVALASQRFPKLHLEVRDLLQNPPEGTSFDYVFASGLFTFRRIQPLRFMETVIKTMYSCSRRGVAFNSLSSWATDQEVGEFYADPLATMAFCRSLSPWVTLRHDYHPRDFTIYLYKERNLP